MKLLATIALGIVLLPAPHSLAQGPALPLEHREFIVRNFKTESGAVLPEARLIYTTLGRLNAAGMAGAFRQHAALESHPRSESSQAQKAPRSRAAQPPRETHRAQEGLERRMRTISMPYREIANGI